MTIGRSGKPSQGIHHFCTLVLTSLIICGASFAVWLYLRPGADFERALVTAKRAKQNDQIDTIISKKRRISLTGGPALQSVVQVESTSDGNIAVVDINGRQVSLYGTDGSYVHAVGSQGNRPSQYITPTSLTILSDSYAVADFSKRRVNIYSKGGTYLNSFIYTPQNFSASRILYLEKEHSFVLSGNRYISDISQRQQVQFLHFYTMDGRFTGSALQLPPNAVDLNLISDDRLIAVRGPAGEYLCFLPFSRQLYRVDGNDKVESRSLIDLPGFREPTSLIPIDSNPASYQSWELKWTPIVATAASDKHLLVEYQTFNPLRYTVVVLTNDSFKQVAIYTTNYRLVSSESHSNLYWLKNISNIGDQQYELVQGQME